MILFEPRRRVRKNGLHAETEEEFLQKLVKQEEDRQQVEEQQQLSPNCDGFIINEEFSFNNILSEPIFVMTVAPTYKSHFLLLISDDFSMNLKRIQSLLDSSENSENLTVSTQDDQNTQSQLILKQDYYVHIKSYGNCIHKFHIWILNHLNPPQIFQQQYYPKMKAFIIICNNANNSKLPLIQEYFPKLLKFNPKIVKYQIFSENEDCFEKQNSFTSIFDQILEL